ncbi:MAG TPA: hypothetical protein VGQ83_15585 [Polyangia bacterium]|jgi:hypothetical protein
MSPSVAKIIRRMRLLYRLHDLDAPPDMVEDAQALVGAARAEGGEPAWHEAQQHFATELRDQCAMWEALASFVGRCAADCLYCDAEVLRDATDHSLAYPHAPWCTRYEQNDTPDLVTSGACVAFRLRN